MEGTKFGQGVRLTFKKIAPTCSTASVAASLVATSSSRTLTAPQLPSTRGIIPPQVTQAEEVTAVEEGVAPMEGMDEATVEGHEDVEVVEPHYNLKITLKRPRIGASASDEPDAPSDVEEEVAEKERAEVTVVVDDAVSTPSSSVSVQSRP